MTARMPRRSERANARRAAFAVIALTTAFSLIAVAQPKRPAPKPAAAAPKRPPAKPSGREDEGDASAPLTSKEGPEPTIAARDAGRGAALLEQKTLDGGQRVFRFGEVEVEGRLKSPQIVYFLRRVRAEFAAGDLGHRSFMRELSETKNEPSF